MKKLTVISFVLVILLTLTACSAKSNAAINNTIKHPSVSPILLTGLDAKEALALANEWKISNSEVTSFITPDKLHFEFPDNNNVEISLPKDKMMIAIAPYITKTHRCSTHYVSGCQGELADIPVRVLAVQKNGTVLVDSTMKTMSNGFIELWLPRDLNITLTMESMNKKVEGLLTTYSDSNTCITTMQLL